MLIFEKFGLLCVLETPVFRLALLPYYQRNTTIYDPYSQASDSDFRFTVIYFRIFLVQRPSLTAGRELN